MFKSSLRTHVTSSTVFCVVVVGKIEINYIARHLGRIKSNHPPRNHPQPLAAETKKRQFINDPTAAATQLYRIRNSRRTHTTIGRPERPPPPNVMSKHR